MTKKQCSIVKFNDTTFPLQSTKHRATRPELNCFREGYKKVGKYGIFMVLGCNYQRQGFTKEERAGSCSQQQVGGSAHLNHQVSTSLVGWNLKDLPDWLQQRLEKLGGPWSRWQPCNSCWQVSRAAEKLSEEGGKWMG